LVIFIGFFMSLPLSHINPKTHSYKYLAYILREVFGVLQQRETLICVLFTLRDFCWQRQEVDEDRGRRHTICDFETAELY
jgi:hypothetical protein